MAHFSRLTPHSSLLNKRYEKVNHYGTINIIDACKAHGVPKIVMSSSPSTRFDGSDVDGVTEADMPKLPMKSYVTNARAVHVVGCDHRKLVR